MSPCSIIIFTVLYAASFLFSLCGQYILSGAVLIICALMFYAKDSISCGNAFSLKGLFSLGFLGGEGISALKLSYLQTDWEPMTWICFFIAFAAFRIAHYLTDKKAKERKRNTIDEITNIEKTNTGIKVWGRKIKESFLTKFSAGTDFDKLYVCIFILSVISVLSFIIEAAVLGFIPLFLRGVPHAYSIFHISGLHYFTVSAVLIPSLVLIWFFGSGNRDMKKIVPAALAVCVSVLIPILCVSRFQLAFSVVLVLFTYASFCGNIKLKHVMAVCVLLLPVYLLLSVARSHDTEYLNSIFEMKKEFPILISHPYIYVANNYDNFNAMVVLIERHTYGLKMLFPLFAFTGLKFICPELVSFPLYTTKEELTTVTLFYDAYYDFGLVGILIFAVILGSLCSLVQNKLLSDKNGIYSLFYSQLAVYMALSFFTTWFSNPTTWFYFGITALIYLICGIDGLRKRVT